MMGTAHRAVAAIACFAAASCGTTHYKEPQTVTAEGPNLFWVVGSEGYAARFDGSSFRPHDYPFTSGAPDWAYERGYSDIPAARVVRVDGHSILITRVGDFLRWTGTAWLRLPVSIPSEYGDDFPQIDTVLNTPDGGLLIHVHSQTLLFGTLEAFTRNRYREEKLPSYFTWLGYAGRELYGLGWDASGNIHALLRRDLGGTWVQVALLGRNDPFGEAKCVLALRDGRPVVVNQYALLDPSSEPPTVSPTSVLPLIRATTTVGEQLAMPANAKSVSSCFVVDPDHALLTLSNASSGGSPANVLTADKGRMKAWKCPDAEVAMAVGAIRRGDDWLLVTRELRMSAIPGPACVPVSEHAGLKVIAQ